MTTKTTTAKRVRPHAKRYDGPSITQQQFKESSDVNNIVRRFTQTGVDPYELRKSQQRFGDASEKTYFDAMLIVADVNSQFAKLPSHIRSTFDNNPHTLLEAFSDADQQENLASLGLIPPPDEIIGESVPDAVLDPPPEPAQKEP